MSFSGEFQFLGPQGQYGQRMWMYETSDDSVNTAQSSGYFNKVYDQVNLDDIIWVKGNNTVNIKCALVRVTSAQGVQPVTVAPYVGEYSVGNENPYPIESMTLKLNAGAAQEVDHNVFYQYRLLDVFVTTSTQGQSGDTLTVQTNGGTHNYTSAIDLNVGEGVIARTTFINQDYPDLLVGDNNLRLKTVKGGANDVAAMRVTLLVQRVAAS